MIKIYTRYFVYCISFEIRKNTKLRRESSQITKSFCPCPFNRHSTIFTQINIKILCCSSKNSFYLLHTSFFQNKCQQVDKNNSCYLSINSQFRIRCVFVFNFHKKAPFFPYLFSFPSLSSNFTVELSPCWIWQFMLAKTFRLLSDYFFLLFMNMSVLNCRQRNLFECCLDHVFLQASPCAAPTTAQTQVKTVFLFWELYIYRFLYALTANIYCFLDHYYALSRSTLSK